MAELKYVDWDGLVYYDGKIKQYIQDRDENYVKMGGIISFEELPDPTYYNLHYIYKITDDFTSNSRFDKAGLVYKAGTWVQCIDVHDDASRYRYTIFNEETIGGTADIDLSDYYTKKEVDERIEDAIDKLDIPQVNLDNYYTKSEVDELIPDDIPSKGYVDELFETAVTEGELDAELSSLNESVAGVLESIEELNDKFDAIQVPDVSNLATKEEVAAVEAKVDAIVVPKVPTKVSELENDTGYITAEDIPETDLSNYYNKSETENLIAEAVKDIEHPTVDLEGYATESWVNEQGFIKEVPSEYVTDAELDAKGYLTEHQDLSDYAKKSDIPQPELFVVDFNAPNFAAALEAYNNGKLLLLTNAAPDGTGYAVMNYVRDDLITFTKFLMSRSETYGSFNTYYLHNDNTWELAKEVKLNKVDATVDANNDITGLVIGKNTYDFDNFATTETVNQINETVQNIENTYVSTDVLEQKNYVTNDYIEQQNYVTNTTLEAKEYITTSEATTKIEQIVKEEVAEAVTPDAINYDTWE